MNSTEALTDNRKEYRLGVLLVHGIGTQPCGDTLVRWGDSLLKAICDATRNKVQTHVGRAGRDGEGTHDAPMTAEIRLQSSSKTEKWLFADGWWADVFLPPNYQELVSWSVRALPWAIAIHIAQRFWNSPKHKKRASKFVYNAFAVLKLLAGLALAPICVLLLGLTLALGLLPIPQLRSLILAAQGTLVSTVGDCLAFVESPVRAALIRTRILNRLNWLKQRCERTIIIAHSQGAAIVLDALGAIRDPIREGASSLETAGVIISKDEGKRDAPSSATAPDTLVTFGAGTNQLTSLKRLSAGLPSAMSVNPVIYAMGGLFVFGGVLAWLFVAAMLHQTTAIKILFATGAFIVLSAVLGVFMLAGVKATGWISKRSTWVKKHEVAIVVPTMTVLCFALIITLSRFADKNGLPIFPASVIFMTLLVVIGGMFKILSKEMKEAVTMVVIPSKLRYWYDLYASADPVPNGPTRLQTGSGAPQFELAASSAPPPNNPTPTEAESGGPKFKPIPIFNLGSFFGDHTAYWDNLDGFVLPVIRACAETADSSWKSELPPELPAVKDRASWRVDCLRLARYAIYLSWLVAAAGLWSFYSNAIPLPFNLPGWLPMTAATMARLVMFAAAIAVAAWLSVRTLQLFWRRWVRSEQQLLFARQAIGDKEFLWLLGFGYLVWFFIEVAYFAGADRLPSLATPSALGDIAAQMFLLPIGASFLSVVILAWWWRPGPEVPTPK